MVSSGQVSSDSSSLSAALSQYSSVISGLAGSWQGDSYNNISAKTGEFVSEYDSSISSQMASFTTACELYEQYKQLDEKDKLYRQNYDACFMVNDTNSAKQFCDLINQGVEQMNALIGQIQTALQSVCSISLSASPKEYSVSSLNTKGEIVNYYQYDYGDYSYGYGSTIASSGCGPTAMAMVLSQLTGEEVTPPETAQWSLDHGYRIKNQGTSWAYFDSISDAYGINCRQESVSSDNIVASLQNDETVIMAVGPGHFTSDGHYIVLTGMDEAGNITIADPASSEKSAQSWPIDVFLNEGTQMWSFS